MPAWEQGTAVANSCHFNRSNLLVSSAKEGVPLAWQYNNPACCLHWDSWSIVVVGSSKLSGLTLPAFEVFVSIFELGLWW